MFEENEKFTEEFMICKDIVDIQENDDLKIYTFSNGKKVELDKDYEVCGELKNNKIKIKKNELYGIIQFYDFNYEINDTKEETKKMIEKLENNYEIELNNYERKNNRNLIEIANRFNDDKKNNIELLYKFFYEIGYGTYQYNDKKIEIKHGYGHNYDYNIEEVYYDGNLVFSKERNVPEGRILKNDVGLFYNELLDFANNFIKELIIEEKMYKDKLDKDISEIRIKEKEKLDILYQKKEKGYYIIEPKYEELFHYSDDIILAKDEKKLYRLYNGAVLQEYELKDFKSFKDGSIFNNNVLYTKLPNSDDLYHVKAKLYVSKDFERTYIISDQGSLVISVYSKDGELINAIMDKDEKYNYIPNIDVTSDHDIIKVGDSLLINVSNNKTCDFKNGRYSDFINGHALIEMQNSNVKFACSEVYSLDKDFNIKELDFGPISISTFSSNLYDQHIIDLIQGYISISTQNNNHFTYGFSDTAGNIVVPCKYDTVEASIKALEKYILKREAKALKEKERLSRNDNPTEDNNISNISIDDPNERLYSLEDEIKSYLSKMKIPELDLKLKIMQNEYKKMLDKCSSDDIAVRKKVLSGSLIGFENGELTNLRYNEYKNSLIDFKNKLKDNMYIINILDKLNQIGNQQSDDELVKDLNNLYNLYSNLNEELKNKNINSFNSLIKTEKEYFKNYLFRKDYYEKCKYSSEQEWINSFRTKLQVLIEQLKSDLELQEISKQVGVYKDANNNLDENRYKIIYNYCKRINEMIVEIESKTVDNEILSRLEKYRNIQIDFTKTPIENLNSIINKYKELLVYQQTVEYILESQKYATYDPDRKTKK